MNNYDYEDYEKPERKLSHFDSEKQKFIYVEEYTEEKNTKVNLMITFGARNSIVNRNFFKNCFI